MLSNHDRPRHRTRYGGSERRARAAAVLLLGWRGTPFLYAGEELGLEDAVISAARTLDPGGRDGCRAPIPWEPVPDHGWELAGRSGLAPVAAAGRAPQRRDPVAGPDVDPPPLPPAARRPQDLGGAQPGDLVLVAAPESVVAYRREWAGEVRVVVVGFGEDECDRGPGPAGRTGPGSSRSPPAARAASGPRREPYLGRIGPEEALILRAEPLAPAPVSWSRGR